MALLDFAGTIGLLIGIAWRPVGIAAAIGVALYFIDFISALIAHVRAKAPKGMPMPAVLLIVAVLAPAFGIAAV